MTIQDKLDSLTEYQLKTVIMWTLNDLHNAATSENYLKLDEKVRSWCAMLAEAVEYQVDKAINSTIREEE